MNSYETCCCIVYPTLGCNYYCHTAVEVCLLISLCSVSNGLSVPRWKVKDKKNCDREFLFAKLIVKSTIVDRIGLIIVKDTIRKGGTNFKMGEVQVRRRAPQTLFLIVPLHFFDSTSTQSFWRAPSWWSVQVKMGCTCTPCPMESAPLVKTISTYIAFTYLCDVGHFYSLCCIK